jgi:hypothetical protein
MYFGASLGEAVSAYHLPQANEGLMSFFAGLRQVTDKILRWL